MTNPVISVVHQRTIKPTVLVRLAVCCAIVALLWATTLGIARDGASLPDNRPVNLGMVPQAHLDPHTVPLPVVDGTDIRFAHISTADGLSQTKVDRIVQDDQGFMWFGTQYGLNRYDGYNFKVFAHDPGDPNSVSGVYIRALFKDRDGTLWVGCDQFINKFDPKTETFTRYPVPFVNHISQDSAGVLWLATSTGLYALDPATGRIHRYSHDPNDSSSIGSNVISMSGEDKAGRFWVANTGGLDEFDRRTGKVTLHIPLPERPSLAKLLGARWGYSFYEDRFGTFWIFNVSGNPLAVLDRKTNMLTQYSFHNEKLPATAFAIRAVCEDHDGTLWLATHDAGLLKFDREHRKFVRYHNNPGDPQSLPENSVISLFADREGSIWAGLGRIGLTRFDSKPLPFKRVTYNPSDPNSTVEPFVGAIYEDSQRILWVGTPDVLMCIDRKAGHYTSYRTSGPGARSDVITIREDHSGNLWVGTYGHGLHRFDPQTGQFKTYRHDPADPYSLSNDIVSRLLVDHNGTLWAGTQDALNRFDAATERFTTYKLESHEDVDYVELVEDRDGTLWLGTDTAGLRHFDPATGRVTRYGLDMNRPGTLSDNRVNSVHFDASGTMWVGTQNGLDKFDTKTGTFAVYTRRDGLPGNAVGCILGDDHGDLWMSTNNGVARFNPRSRTFKNYSMSDGLPGPDLTGWGACIKSSSGEMFFGGFSGATAFFPDKVTDASYTPPIVLTDLRLPGNSAKRGSHFSLQRSVSYTSDLVLSHKQNVFSLGFAALSYSNSATNRYRYKLEGLERDWNEVGSDHRQATYTTLPVGRYTFRVQGATSGGAWSEPGVAVRIEILPPWWSTWWFRAVCVAASVMVLGGFYQWRIQQLQRQEKHLRDVVETIPAMAFSARPDGSTEFINRPWLDYTGSPEKDNLGSGWQVTVHPDDLDEHLNKWRESLATGAPFENEARHRDAHGEYRWFLVRAVPLRDEHGNILKWYGTLTDIEDRKRSEQERERFLQLQADLAHENRLSMMGELAASLSHELKQPITAAITDNKTSLRWLTRDQPDVEEAREAIMRAMKDSTRAAEIIDRLRSFYKTGAPLERELVDVNELVREMLVLLRSEADRYSIRVRTDLAAELPRVTADRVQVQQVLMNLMLNGIEAMKDTSGELTIKSELGQDRQLLISVSDTGVGLPAEKADQIFNAFFTTKPQGSGMGLPISRSIVESHGGRLWASANNGGGTTFQFTLRAEVTRSSPSVA